MKYEKLKAIVKKEKRFDRLANFFAVILTVIMMIALLTLIMNNCSVIKTIIALIVSGIILLPPICIFSAKSDRYSNSGYDYICIKIMDIIAENGIKQGSFEMFDEAHTGIRYIGFHNQNVDYDDLRSKLNTELDEMNKISGRHIRVKLI